MHPPGCLAQRGFAPAGRWDTLAFDQVGSALAHFHGARLVMNSYQPAKMRKNLLVEQQAARVVQSSNRAMPADRSGHVAKFLVMEYLGQH